MSIACCVPVVECVYCLACARWAWQRCLHTTGYDSHTWGLASSGGFVHSGLLKEKSLVCYMHLFHLQKIQCGRYPPTVRTAVPVDGRFEHIVLSCNAISDHPIIWIEREAQRAVDLMLESKRTMKAPENQRMDAETTLTRDHDEEQQAALRRAVALGIADVNLPSSYGTFSENPAPEEDSDPPVLSESGRLGSTVWDESIVRIFEKDESGQMVPRR